MNFYAFHIGDYAVHTRHLSLLEDLAYRRLLDLYYTRESTLPESVDAVARLIGMREQAADVEAVLREFFTAGDDGWRHVRCDAEIAHMQDKQSKARASAQASVSARQANAQRTLNDRSATNTITNTNTITKNQEETKTPRKRAPAAPDVSVADLMAEGVDQTHAEDWIRIRKLKDKPLTRTAWKGVKAEGLSMGMTPAETVEYATTNNWAGFKAKWTEEERAVNRGPPVRMTRQASIEANNANVVAQLTQGDFDA